MLDEQKEFIKKVNIDKAKKKVIISIILIILSLFTYILPMMFKIFDFGVIFEIASLIFLLISRVYMSKYDEVNSKRYVVCSIAAIGWILVYDIIRLCSYIEYAIDLIFLGRYLFYGEFWTILYLIILVRINKDLSKADNPIRINLTVAFVSPLFLP